MAKGNDEPIDPAQQNDATTGEEETLRGMDDVGVDADDDDEDFDADDLEDEEEDEEGGGGF